MFTSLESHNFSAADRAWLSEAATDDFDPRIARAKLYETLPKDFDPNRIDRRFYDGDKLTLMGLQRFKPSSKLLKDADLVANTFRDKILAKPGVEIFDVNSLCEELGISRQDMQNAIIALQGTTQFFTGLSHSPSTDYVEQVHFSGPNGYDGPLKFISIAHALDRLYKIQGHNSFRHSGSLIPFLESEKEVPKAKRILKSPSTIKKNTAFVIMAIDISQPELIDILDAIKHVASRFGISAFRADELEHQDVITNVVLEQIRNCEYLIADLTHERPNVYYEIGYAHAMDKKPILYRKRGAKLHFDLSVHNVPEYANVRELKDLLNKRFEAILGRVAA